MDMHSDPQYRSEDGNALRIWRDAAPNNFLSEREGRPIFDEVINVEVIAPGSGNSTPVFELVRYPNKELGSTEPKYGPKYQELKKFVADFIADETSDASLSGTPLAEWSEMKKSLIAGLKAQKLYTVEALAHLPDAKLSIVGPDGRTWREKAIAYLESAKGNAYATKLAADLEVEKANNANLQTQVADLAKQVADLQAAGTAQSTAAQKPKGGAAAAVEPPPAAEVAAPAASLTPIV